MIFRVKLTRFWPWKESMFEDVQNPRLYLCVLQNIRVFFVVEVKHSLNEPVSTYRIRRISQDLLWKRSVKSHSSHTSAVINQYKAGGCHGCFSDLLFLALAILLLNMTCDIITSMWTGPSWSPRFCPFFKLVAPRSFNQCQSNIWSEAFLARLGVLLYCSHSKCLGDQSGCRLLPLV